MFQSFFKNKEWWRWSILGSALIILTVWYKVQLDVKLNEWFGSFYNLVQKALTAPNSVELNEILSGCWTFIQIAMVLIILAVLLEFFVRHYVFRWRTAMNDYYINNWDQLHHIEGASQRVQEDTMRFAQIVERLGVSFLRAILTLIAFLPILWTLSGHITELPWIGKIDHSLIYLAILSSIFGTSLVALAGIKLPGLEYNNQKVEAAYRKELVLGEDNEEYCKPPTAKELYANVRKNYYRLYLHYMYFDVAKWSYLQASTIIPLVALAPTIVAGAITFGLFQQIIRAFGTVESAFQYLVNSWSTIVELMSIYKRLNEFEKHIK